MVCLLLAMLIEEATKVATAQNPGLQQARQRLDIGKSTVQRSSASTTSSEETATAPPKTKPAKLFESLNLPTGQSSVIEGGHDSVLRQVTRAVEELLDDNNADMQAYNQHKYAILKPLVQQVLSAPASSASSE
jgi:hypothetical protein